MVDAYVEDFVPRGVVSVSDAALTLAREFAIAIGNLDHGSQVVTFDWALSLIERGPGLPERELGPCLMIGAYRRDEVPLVSIGRVDGFAFAIRIPEPVVNASLSRRIEFDDGAPFGVVLR
jgi:hypothetical protein